MKTLGLLNSLLFVWMVGFGSLCTGAVAPQPKDFGKSTLKLNLPPRKTVHPNAQDDYLKAVAALKDERWINAAYEASPSGIKDRLLNLSLLPFSKEKVLQKNRDALQYLRQALAGNYWSDANLPDQPSPIDQKFEKIRLLERLLVLEGRMRANGGDWTGATDSYLDAVRMGGQIKRGDVCLERLVGCASEAIGQRALGTTIRHLNGRESLELSRKLLAISAATFPYSETLREESRYVLTGYYSELKKRDAKGREIEKEDASDRSGEKKQSPEDAAKEERFKEHIRRHGKQKTLDDLADYFARLVVKTKRPFILESRPKFRTFAPSFVDNGDIFEGVWVTDLSSQTRTLLLATLAALHAYYLDHSEYPARLSDLQPRYLAALPTDPFSNGQPLRYRKTEENFVLYGIGQDGKDNGGKPLDDNSPSLQGPSVSPLKRLAASIDYRGDIVANARIIASAE